MKKKELPRKIDKQKYLFLSLVIIIILAVLLPNLETNCENNQDCFNEAAQKCSRAKVYIEDEDNLFEYRIVERKIDSCHVTIKVVQVSPEADQETIDLFEGKSMECNVPFEITEITNTNDIIDYCSGPLKESIYELIIKKMYGVIAQNLGSIISEVKENI